MFLRILKKDLKRKKTMNVILLLFIVMATMFVASGINNVVTVMNGSDYYFDRAGIGNYDIITMGKDAVGALDEMLETQECIEDYRIETVVFGAKGNVLLEDGTKAECHNALILQSIEQAEITFFNADDEPVNEVKPGHAYATADFMKVNDLKPGDVVHIKHSNVEFDLIMDGKLKDALLGSTMMGNTRLLMNGQDYNKLLEDNFIVSDYRGQICYLEVSSVKELSAALSTVSNIAFDGTRSTIKMCYVMDMIVAMITLILSVILIIVSFVILKFTITFTIREEFREIGVMKAIGICNTKIRGLYIGKYLMMAAVGSFMGFLLSIPFGKLLLKSVTENMVLGNDAGVMINLIGALLVVVIIIAFAYLCTGKVKKATPVDAIRSGQTGERYKKKTKYRLARSHTKPGMYLALNDVVSAPKRFLSVIISFSLCTLIVLVLLNTVNTMKSDAFIGTFGKESDLYLTDVSESMELMHATQKEEVEKWLTNMEAELAQMGYLAKISLEIQYRCKLSFEGNDFNTTFQQGFGTHIADYDILEGSIPQDANEIAITKQISEKTGAKIGDVVVIDYGSEQRECRVTAYFQTMNQLGEVIRLHEDAPTDLGYVSSMMGFQIDFLDHPSEKEINNREAELKKFYKTDELFNKAEYCAECIGVVDTMELVQKLLLAITMVVIVMVTILMERSFIADEKSQIALLKALGFPNRAIIKWQIYRFGIVSLLAGILAAALSIPVTNLSITPIFKMMGMGSVHYRINGMQIFLIYPVMIVAVTIFAAFLTAQYTRKIGSSDTANIE